MATDPITIESLLETHEEPFVVLDEASRFVAINRAFAEIFSVDPESLIGQPCGTVFFAARDKHPVHPTHQSFFTSGETYMEVRTHSSLDGNSYLVRARGIPVFTADNRFYLGESIRPLTFHRGQTEVTPKMHGQSDAFQRLLLRLDKAAASNATVLLHGETGTGKELAAEYIHMHSVRNGRPFVIADCTVFSTELFESELFGHEKGSFTGSTSEKKGLFELANGGTLFLDEMGELPLRLQAKLLRALEYGTFRRVGGTRTLTADVRVICATNCNLAEMVKAGTFRQDLFYRIVVFPVPLPPLRERMEDIPLLAQRLLERLESIMGKHYALSPGAVVKLQDYWYPGNIRELSNVLQLAASLCDDTMIHSEHVQFPEVPPKLPDLDAEFEAAILTTEPALNTPQRFPSMDAVEVQYLTQLIEKFNGDKRKIAAHMGVSERTLYRKLQRLKPG